MNTAKYANLVYQVSLKEYAGVSCTNCEDKLKKLKIANFLDWVKKNL